MSGGSFLGAHAADDDNAAADFAAAAAAAAVQPTHKVPLPMPISRRCPPDKQLLRFKLAQILAHSSAAEVQSSFYRGWRAGGGDGCQWQRRVVLNEPAGACDDGERQA